MNTPDTTKMIQPEEDALTETQPSLQQWVRQLNDQEMPAFANTTHIISRASHSEETSASQLAREILQDPTMMVRVLKMANNIFHNPSQRTISTVSRAIVVLGFNTVRSICLSLSIVDNMLSSTNRENLLRELARSFHAATQARTMAIKRKDPSPEEIYIATLMYNLGQMVFWCFADRFDRELSRKLDKALSQPGYPSERAERDVLGFTLSELSVSLNREWHISPLLEKALGNRSDDNPRISNINMGYELADNSAKGWDRPETKQVIKRIAESLYMPSKEVTKVLQANAEEARATMMVLGAGKASKHIRMPSYPQGDTSAATNAPQTTPDTSGKTPAAVNTEPQTFKEDQYLYPDKELQLTILTELSDATNGNANLILEMVLEGIYRGIGMDRTVLALLSPDRRSIRAKHALGWDRIKVTAAFHFEVSPISTTNIIDYVLTTRKTLWIPHPPSGNLASLITPGITALTGKHPFFMAPVIIKNRPIGLFYADRAPSGRELHESDYASFNLFCKQANMGLSNI